MGGKAKSGGTKGKNDNDQFPLTTASGNFWHEREARLLSKSSCVLIPFVVLQLFFFFLREVLESCALLSYFFLAVSRIQQQLP